MATYLCRCGAPFETRGMVGFNEICDKCREYRHACINCRFFDRRAQDCTDPAAEEPRTRDGKNQCAYFEPLTVPQGGGPAADDPKSAEARRKLEQLFGKPPKKNG
jgi:hypothetical protein